MNDIMTSIPEVPDPIQLDLFTITTKESQSVSFTNEHVGNIDQRSRDPSAKDLPIMVSGKRENLTETQKELASALHRKSIELVSKNYQATIQEVNQEP